MLAAAAAAVLPPDVLLDNGRGGGESCEAVGHKLLLKQEKIKSGRDFLQQGSTDLQQQHQGKKEVVEFVMEQSCLNPV